MLRKTDGYVTWLEFELFADCKLVHGIFLKHGGVSPSPFASLNFGLSQGDKPENVRENKKRALRALKLRGKELFSCLQIHGTKIHQVVSQSPSLFENGDALTTSMQEAPLLVQHADCQAAVFYDPIQHVLGIAHCGWRGNVQNIYLEMVRFLSRTYGSKPQNLLVGISPSLGPSAAEFINYKSEFPESFWTFQHKPTYFNLWDLSRWQLETCGVLPHHIQIAALCTFENTHDFFSYRRAKQSGRHATIAALI